MAGASFQKRAREQAKLEKAQAKGARREARLSEAAAAAAEAPEPVSQEDAPKILNAIAQLHEQFDAGQVSLDDFEARKSELMARLPVD
jgi:hypothetical protein